MLAQYKTDIIQITAYIPVMLKDFYYNPSNDHKTAVLKKIQKTNLFLEEWKHNLISDKAKTNKSDTQFIQKFAKIVNKEALKQDRNNTALREANLFAELLMDLGKTLEQQVIA